jgi:hypothetical protein
VLDGTVVDGCAAAALVVPALPAGARALTAVPRQAEASRCSSGGWRLRAVAGMPRRRGWRRRTAAEMLAVEEGLFY